MASLHYVSLTIIKKELNDQKSFLKKETCLMPGPEV